MRPLRRRAIKELVTVAAMTDEQRRAFRDEEVVPDGWHWCPDCNGEGVISVMDGTPDLNEHEHDCHRCEAERGIVPKEDD